MFLSPVESDLLFGEETMVDDRTIFPAFESETPIISIFSSFRLFNFGLPACNGVVSNYDTDLTYRAIGDSLKDFYSGELPKDSPVYLDIEKVVALPLVTYKGEGKNKVFAVDVVSDTNYATNITSVKQTFHIAFLSSPVFFIDKEDCEKGAIEIISHSYSPMKKSSSAGGKQRIVKFEITSRENTFYGIVVVDSVILNDERNTLESLRWKYLYTTKQQTEEIFDAFLAHSRE